MGKIFAGRGFEGEHVDALRIYPGHDVLNSAVFASGIHGLENQEQAPLALSVENILHFAEKLNALNEEFLGLGLVFGIEMMSVSRVVIH